MTILSRIAAQIQHNNGVIESERLRIMDSQTTSEDHNDQTCTDRECLWCGDVCGGCGSFIIEAAEAGDGEGIYHHRFDVDCRTARRMTF